MNIGSMILALRKQKNVTQEALAAELGVTAAAVSKWEKGYTLPDILMVCALADYFEVTTDALLGRTAEKKQAIIVAQTEALGRKIAALAQQYGIHAHAVLTDYDAALAEADCALKTGGAVHYIFTAIDRPLEERETDDTNGIIHVNVRTTDGIDDTAVNGIELYLKNEDTFKNITNVTANMKK